MKRVLAVALCAIMMLGLSGCGNGAKEDNENSKSKVNSALKNVKIGDTITYKDLFELTINEVETVDIEKSELIKDLNEEFDDEDVNQIIIFSYSYKNLNSEDDDILIGQGDFQIIDEDGNVCKWYNIPDLYRGPEPTPIGSKSEGTYTFALKQKSDKIRCIFKPYLDGGQVKIFETEFKLQ